MASFFPQSAPIGLPQPASHQGQSGNNPTTGQRIVVVSHTRPIYEQVANVIQLRETVVELVHPTQLTPPYPSNIALWVAVLDRVDQQPNWLLPILDTYPPTVVVLPQWHDEAAVSLFDANVADILVPPLPDVYLATRLLQALARDDEYQRLAQAYEVLTHHNLRSPEGVWSASAWSALSHPLLEATFQHHQPLSAVIWQPNTMSPQVLEQLRYQLVGLCRGDDIVMTTTDNHHLAVVLPHTSKQACQGFLQRIQQAVPGLLPHHAISQTILPGQHPDIASLRQTVEGLLNLPKA